MTALDYYDAGFKELVSVMPPDAQLSPGSKIDPSQRGKCPGRKGNQGWYGYAFTKEIPTREDVEQWLLWEANVGLIGNKYPGLDIDTEDEAVTKVAAHIARDVLGMSPVRTSRYPRSLLVYHSEIPLARRQLAVMYKGKRNLIELLGKGRQYLIEGKHPSGSMYGWKGEGLISPGQLNMITPDMLDEYFDTLQAYLERKGMEVTVDRGRDGEQLDVAQDHLLAPNYRQLQDLVERIPNPATNGWHEMVQMGYAIKASDEAAPAIFLEWCDRWEGGVSEPEMNVANWESFLPPFQIGWPWLQDQAQEAGEYSVAVDTFDADPDAEEPEEYAEEEGDPQAGQITFTDEWAVNQLLPSVRKRLRYVPINKQWYFWEGHIWARDETLAHERWIRNLLHRLSVRLWDQASALEGDEAKPYRTAARKYQNGDAIGSIIRLAKAQITASPTDFDQDLLTLNTPGGPVDLRTGEVTDPDPKDMLSRSVLVEPKDGPAPRWAKFMKDLTGSDPDLIRYLQKLVGYALTGDVSAKTLWFLWGSDTDTGKSTFIRIVSKLLHTYADSVDVSVFINGKGSRSESLARLPGVRLVTSTEPQAGHAWDEKRIKAITGGDDIEARALYGHPFVYTPQFKIIIVGNQEPEIKNVDDAMLRRIRIVPINIRVAEKDKIDNLAEILVEEEGPQILAWFIRGCILQREEGLEAPAVVAARTKEYELAEDSLTEWVEEECDRGDDYRVSRQALYHAWTVWSLSRGEEPGGLKAFKRRVDARFHFEDKKVGPETRRQAGFKGIQLKPRVAAGTQEF